jgi:hypothetical protein
MSFWRRRGDDTEKNQYYIVNNRYLKREQWNHEEELLGSEGMRPGARREKCQE